MSRFKEACLAAAKLGQNLTSACAAIIFIIRHRNLRGISNESEMQKLLTVYNCVTQKKIYHFRINLCNTLINVPYILESNSHLFTLLEGQKIRCRLQLRAQ
jgi:hypothetical protein